MSSKHYLVPDYILKFKCSMCTECCKRWRIDIDKKTVEKYERLAAEDGDLSVLLAEHLKKDKTGKGIIVLKNREKSLPAQTGEGEKEPDAVDFMVAPCLSGDGLCSIQKKYGLEALPDTCKIYPRNIFLTERGWEMTLTYACATAAQTLKEKRPVEFYQDPEGFEFPSLSTYNGKIGNLMERKKKGKTSYFEVEELLVDIMQSREMDIDARLTLAGLMVDKLKDGDTSGVKRYLQNLDAELINRLNTMPAQPLFMMKLVKEAVDKRLFIAITEKDIARLLVIAYNQLKLLDEGMITEEKVRRLLDGYHKYYKPYMTDISHIYENYFVNFIFSKKFYTYKYVDAYFLMVFFYTLVRFFTICVCLAEERNVDEDMVVGVISAVERSIGHSNAYFEDVLRQIKQGEYHRLPYVISLINL